MRHIITYAAGLALLATAAPILSLCARPFESPGTCVAPADTVSLSLEESVRRALANNAGLLVMREKVKEAGAAADEARTAFFPQITGNAAYTKLDTAPYIPASRFSIFGGPGSIAGGSVPDRITIGLRDNYAAALELKQPLFAAGRIRNAYDRAKLAERASESELDRTTDELVFEAEKAYLRCLEAQELEQVARERARQLEAHLGDLEAMFDAGLAATNDVLKTKVYESDARLSLMKAQHATRLAKDYLASIIDVPLTTELVLTSRADAGAGITIEIAAAVEAAVARRPEIAELEYRRLMTQKQVGIDRNGHLPTFAFFAKLGYQYPDREYEKDFYSSWALGVSAQMNIFDWGGTVYRTRQSRSRLRQIEIAAQDVRDAVTLDVTRSYLTLLDAWKGIGVARENVAQAEENCRVTNERFKEGLATNTDLLDAEVLLTAARASCSSIVIEYLIARADLTRAMGGAEN
jgi:outer membrane protein